jgi:hypothetical protein
MTDLDKAIQTLKDVAELTEAIHDQPFVAVVQTIEALERHRTENTALQKRLDAAIDTLALTEENRVHWRDEYAALRKEVAGLRNCMNCHAKDKHLCAEMPHYKERCFKGGLAHWQPARKKEQNR